MYFIYYIYFVKIFEVDSLHGLFPHFFRPRRSFRGSQAVCAFPHSLPTPPSSPVGEELRRLTPLSPPHTRPPPAVGLLLGCERI